MIAVIENNVPFRRRIHTLGCTTRNSHDWFARAFFNILHNAVGNIAVFPHHPRLSFRWVFTARQNKRNVEATFAVSNPVEQTCLDIFVDRKNRLQIVRVRFIRRTKAFGNLNTRTQSRRSTIFYDYPCVLTLSRRLIFIGIKRSLSRDVSDKYMPRAGCAIIHLHECHLSRRGFSWRKSRGRESKRRQIFPLLSLRILKPGQFAFTRITYSARKIFREN